MARKPALDARFATQVEREFASRESGPLGVLKEADLEPLPEPVRRYVRASGAVGAPRPRNVRIEFDADMWRKPGSAPMPSRSVQYNFFDHPARIFLMTSRMFALPVQALHIYRAEQATFTVRVASRVTMVDQSGREISEAETVTVLNDWCAFAPGNLVDPRLAWTALDETSARVDFTNGSRRVSATLVVNEAGELVDFVSDDRPDSSSGTFVPMRWSTPLTDYDEVGGIRVATRGDAVYDRPGGAFTYGRFRLRDLQYDVEAPSSTVTAA